MKCDGNLAESAGARDHEQILRWAHSQLHAHGVRLTPVRESVLEFMARCTLPTTFAEIAGSAKIASAFDEATVYRTISLYIDLEIVRQLRFSVRSARFVLNIPGECFSYLICRCCNSITRIEHSKELHLLEHEVAQRHGYSQLTHELELYGTCPLCQQHTRSCHKPAKLMRRRDVR